MQYSEVLSVCFDNHARHVNTEVVVLNMAVYILTTRL